MRGVVLPVSPSSMIVCGFKTGCLSGFVVAGFVVVTSGFFAAVRGGGGDGGGELLLLFCFLVPVARRER